MALSREHLFPTPTLILRQGTSDLVGLYKSLSHKGTGNRWVQRGFIIGTQENFIIMLGSSVSFEILEQGVMLAHLTMRKTTSEEKGEEKKCFLSLMSLD